MREFKKITPEHIDEYTELYINSYPAFKTLDEETRERLRQKTLDELKLDDDVDFWGCFDDGALVASMKVVHFKMNLFGELKPAIGLMSLGVHPLHKKKGIGLSMVKKFEELSREEGALVSALLPFNMSFYRSMGYGYGSKLNEYNIPTNALPKPESGVVSNRKLSLRTLSISDVPEMLTCYEEYVSKNHGAMDKFSEEKRIMAREIEPFRIGCFEAGGIQGKVGSPENSGTPKNVGSPEKGGTYGKLLGYLTYRFIPDNDVNYTLNAISVEEMVYSDGEVLRTLLGFLRNQADQAQHVIIRTGEEDFYHILNSAENTSGNYINFGYLETNISAIGNMYKILEPEAFVRETPYRSFAPGRISATFSYPDALSKEPRSLSIEISEGTWKAGAPMADSLKISISEDNLSSVLMGSCKLSSLIRMGAAKVSSVEKAALLSALLTVSQQPFSNNDY